MLSIITINLNNYSGLKRTLETVEDQRHHGKLQHVIVDGSSTDGSVDLIHDYASRNPNTEWISENDTGIYNAMNKGISLATGEFISFLNSGDELASPDCLNDIQYHLEANEGWDMLYGNIEIITPSGKVKRMWRAGAYKAYKLWIGWIPPHPMFTIRNKIINDHMGFNEQFSIAADYDLSLRILRKADNRIFYLDQTLVRMEDGGASNASLLHIVRANTEVLRSWYQIRGLTLPFWIFVLKPLRKIFQFNIMGKK